MLAGSAQARAALLGTAWHGRLSLALSRLRSFSGRRGARLHHVSPLSQPLEPGVLCLHGVFGDPGAVGCLLRLRGEQVQHELHVRVPRVPGTALPPSPALPHLPGSSRAQLERCESELSWHLKSPASCWAGHPRLRDPSSPHPDPGSRFLIAREPTPVPLPNPYPSRTLLCLQGE